MTEDIYAKPDLTKKVRFQTGVKEDRDTDVCDDIDNVRIYDNFCAEESTPPEKSQDNITEDQQQTVSVNVSSEKRNVFGAAAVLLGLLCLLLLMAVIVLVVLYVVERNRLWEKNSNLQTRYSDEKGLNHNLTLKMNQLEEEKNHLKATNNNLTIERDELQKLLDERRCPNNWTRFGNSCYLKSTSMKNWTDSKKVCKDDKAELVIISSKEEQVLGRQTAG
ncbi:C-type lectin domain family 7 member A-like isoform X2 [Cebidichthys violaceus]|uniref:C-type lectin domain family 7 member A-like isoform X2 n=1 Tax=Cebidichthys violaceus TaxID=271503 RepID=UPI0035CBC1FE